MKILVVAEHDGHALRLGSRSAISFANAFAAQTKGVVQCLVLGHGLHWVARDAATYAPVMVADHPALAQPVADRYAKVMADVVESGGFDLFVAASTTWSKDMVGRAAGLLGGAMASDVIGHEFQGERLCLRRPMFAGAVVATVTLTGKPQIVTVRASAYPPAAPRESPGEMVEITVNASTLPNGIELLDLQSKTTGRPDVTEARVVVSAGRAIKTTEDFERLAGQLADKLKGATGSSRALVDAGITPNALQVGQTGKIVAPDLYIALGISGAVQHLAGMKNSRTIVAINRDPEAPIFEVADYGLVGDIYELVPQLIARLDGP